jgi:hypothetical protein
MDFLRSANFVRVSKRFVQSHSRIFFQTFPCSCFCCCCPTTNKCVAESSLIIYGRKVENSLSVSSSFHLNLGGERPSNEKNDEGSGTVRWGGCGPN